MACALLWLLTAMAVLGAERRGPRPRVVYEWFKLDFTWPDDRTKAIALSSKQFVPENVFVQAAKVWGELVFLSLPRVRPGVPVTLATVRANPSGGSSASPRLEPYPSWAMQSPGECSHLLNIHAIEVDPRGRIWIADTGTVNEEAHDPDHRCLPKLVVMEIDSGHIVKKVILHEAVSRDSSLRDIVIDPAWEMAYISDSSLSDPGVIVCLLKASKDRAYKVRAAAMARPAHTLQMHGAVLSLTGSTALLALSLLDQVLYFSSLSASRLYSVPLMHLQKPGDVSSFVHDLGPTLGANAAIIVDSTNVLYYGLLSQATIVCWNTSAGPLHSNEEIIAEDELLLEWPSSFSLDSNGSLWVVSNRHQTFLRNNVNLDVPNFRLVKLSTGARSYLFARPRTLVQTLPNTSPRLSTQLATSFTIVMLSRIIH